MTRPFDAPETGQIVAFLEQIGIQVVIGALGKDSFLPGVTVCGGAIVVDPETLEWPGDLLHEAGHLALTEPEARDSLDQVSADPGEEMAAIAWSYAAAVAIGLDPAILFHAGGYRGGSQSHIENFAAGRYFGVPLLACYEMSREPHIAKRTGAEPYPTMLRWLR